MATTQSLEQSHWLDHPQTGQETGAGHEIQRVFTVPTSSYSTLAPTVASDTAYDDTDYVVTDVQRGRRRGVLQEMVVTYLKRTEGASPI